MLYTVYRVTLRETREYYIGVHKTNNPNDDYMGSGVMIRRKIQKHGVDAFSKDIIASYCNEQDAYAMEAELVTEEVIKDPLCLNLGVGGHGGAISYDKTEYEFVHKSGVSFKGTRRDFLDAYEHVDNGNLSRMISGNIHAIHGWTIAGRVKVSKGSKETIRLRNKVTLEVVEGTREALKATLGIDDGGLSRVISGKKSRKGWFLDQTEPPTKGPKPSDKVFQFTHDDGTIYIGTRGSFMREYKLTRDMVSRLITGARGRQSSKGWRFNGEYTQVVPV
jgi:hypothetical protein